MKEYILKGEMYMNPSTLIKLVGMAGTALSVSSTLLLGWHSEKSMEQAVQKEVAKALKQMNSKK